MGARRIGRYEVLGRLSAGPSGQVFVGRRPNVGGYTPVCLKVAPPDAPAEIAEVLLSEGRLLSGLDHPSIVEVLELGTRPVPHLVLELLAGEGLDVVMEAAREAGISIPPPVAVTIAQALLDALHHAHTRAADPDAAHRDVAPPNVLVTDEGRTILLDFGIAQHLEASATQTGLIRGRPGYMSPEQLTGGRVDRRTDVYAVGVLLWEMLANDRLFAAANPAQVALAQSRPAPSLRIKRPHLSEELTRAVDRALAKNPEARFVTAAAFSEALGAYLRDASAPWGATAVARYLQDRFPKGRAGRRAALDALAQADVDVDLVCQAFDARPVLELDLPPAVPTQTGDLATAGDLVTEKGAAQPRYAEADGNERTVLDSSAQAQVFDDATEGVSLPDVATRLDDPAVDPTRVPPGLISPSPSLEASTDAPPGGLGPAARRAARAPGTAPTLPAPLGPPTEPPKPPAPRAAKAPDTAATVPPTPSDSPRAAAPEPVRPRLPEPPPAPGLAGWQLWTVLIVGLLVGVAGGALLTWTLLR